jgi:L-ascorbate metabolism protein UlaG (beta-lactamase superfamily)
LRSANNRARTISSRFKRLTRRLRLAAITFVALSVMAIGVIFWLWQDRSQLSDLNWPIAAVTTDTADSVTVTWLGVTTLLFDDNETQVLIDGLFTRPGIADHLFGGISSDIANINFVMAEFRINRLAAIVPVHSHFDHAMDVGIVANRSSAVVLGSESTANIARGANLPVNQYQILANGETRKFGDFVITLIVSRHAPFAGDNKTWFAGKITQPLEQPARTSEWKEGQSYSIVIAHPRGTTLIQGSPGFVKGNLDHISADVVMLSVAGLSRFGRNYTAEYWRETVAAVGASRIYPIHFDDFTRPFGDIALFPKIVDDAVTTAGWINDIAVSGESFDNPPDIQLLPFGKSVVLY